MYAGNKFMCAFWGLVPNDFKYLRSDPLMIEISRQIKLKILVFSILNFSIKLKYCLLFSKDKIIHMMKSYIWFYVFMYLIICIKIFCYDLYCLTGYFSESLNKSV